MPFSQLAAHLRPIPAGSGEPLLPVGAHVTDAGVVYRVWAADHVAVSVAIGGGDEAQRRILLEHEGEGFFSGLDPEGRAGDLYWYVIEDQRLPDPASRFQPLGVEGPSQVIDPRAHEWVTRGWRPPMLRGRVIYELHVGAFTASGTFQSALRRLDALVDLGVNAIELMPLADFAGERNWGYDGVMLFAPARCYGTPDDLRTLIDAAHDRGLAVIVDAVYNHLGPVGNVLPRFSRHYLHPTRKNAWGQSLNYDGPNAQPVREFMLQNVCMWFDEYRVDGLRLDAVHAIEDQSPTHIVAEMAAAAHLRGGFVIAEDERNDARLITRRAEGGWGLNAVWADDFHHTARVALTGDRHAHFASYSGKLDECLTTLRDGWYFHGQPFAQWERPRGTSAGHLEPERFVWCISNHDQVGNRPLGDRLHDVISPEAYRAISMLLCLSPYTPMLFMGQEWAASSPFPFFTDHPGEIGQMIRSGRLREYRETKAFFGDDIIARMPDPQAAATFASAKLKWSERAEPSHATVLALYRECLRLRATEPIFQSSPRSSWKVEQVGDDVLALRWFDVRTDWLLVCTWAKSGSRDLENEFLRPRNANRWKLVIGSNEERFGGRGMSEPDGAGLRLESPGAVLLRDR
jgi:maltooligosyltrehalose trehalohydrolase